MIRFTAMNFRQILSQFIFVLPMTFASQARAWVVERDIVYDQINGQNLTFDIYRGDSNAQKQPALFYIHGGCFNSGSKNDISTQIKKLADQGFVVISVDYRLSQVAPYPAAIKDLQQAVRFVRENADHFRIDPRRIAAHGESAGGYLAAMLGVRPMPNKQGQLDEFSGRVQVVSDWYGRTDLTRAQPRTGVDCSIGFIGVPKTEQNKQLYWEASVLPWVDKESASFIIVHGLLDTQVESFHSQALATEVLRQGGEAKLILIKNEGHGISDPRAWQETKDFLVQKLLLQ